MAKRGHNDEPTPYQEADSISLSSSSTLAQQVSADKDRADDHDDIKITPDSHKPSSRRNSSSESTVHGSPRLSFVHAGESSLEHEDIHPGRAEAKARGDAEVTWKILPRKDQLSILTLARLAEPLSQTSYQAYMFYMLKSFGPTLSDAEISQQAGFMAGAYTLAQCLTAVWWGRLADKEWMGRKNVLIIGLAGTLISTFGFGFSKSFASAMFFRFVGGALNGNVGVMRTMISEIVKEKRFQPKAFLVLPVTFNVGVLIGPVLGGWLQNPVQLYPKVFGPGSKIGGKNGVEWMITFPYALPNILFSCVFMLSILLVIFGLEETHIDRRHRRDRSLAIGQCVGRLLCYPFSRRPSQQYDALTQMSEPHQIELSDSTVPEAKDVEAMPELKPKPRPKLPFRRLFIPNVLLTYLVLGLYSLHVGTFNNMWFIFLSTPRYDPKNPSVSSHTQHLPFGFTGGLGMPPETIGFAIGIIGVIGLVMQFGIYSRVVSRVGVLQMFRLGLLCTFPLVYFLVPYLAVVPTNSAPPKQADGPGIWIVITCLLFLQVLGRTFVLPIGQILINNCSPHPSVLGAVHGMATSTSAFARTIGPVAWSAMYGWGLENNLVGFAWWLLAAEAFFAAAASYFIYEGSGHEIWLDGD